MPKTGRKQVELLLTNMRELGPRRLASLGLVGLAVLAVIGLGTYYLSRPEREPLYTGLSREDIGRIGGVLKDAGVDFDVSADGTAVLVGFSDTARARMLLAEKGLPQNANSGYELFNNLGSFGLTSFMQEVTRTRALEGELARTIQTMAGIKAARVHIVLPDGGSFRREQQPASASVVLRTENAADSSTAEAVRHLIAAAIPGMKLDAVTVLNTEGAVLASGDNAENASTGKKAGLEQQFSREIEANIRRTLTPFLGIGNFEISVVSKLNTDQMTVNETTYDPNSRVERSVRVIKENGTSQNRSKQAPTTVQQNIPAQETGSSGANDSNEENQRREELTNYEIASKTVQTVHDGYEVEKLSIAVIVNKDRLAPAAGAPEAAAPAAETPGGPQAAPLEVQLLDIEQMVASAAGVNKERGDQLKIVATAFADQGNELEAVPPLGMQEMLARQAGTLINAATILAVACLLIPFGLRPAMRAILTRPEAPDMVEAAMLGAPEPEAFAADVANAALAGPGAVNLIEDLTSQMNRSPQKRLEQIVELDEDQAAAILRQWMAQDEKV